MIYNTTLDLTATVNDLAAEGTQAARENLATVSPYITSKTRRLGQWALDLTPPPTMVGRLNLPELGYPLLPNATAVRQAVGWEDAVTPVAGQVPPSPVAPCRWPVRGPV